MRKRKWLIIVVAILLLINLLFFLLSRFIDIKVYLADVLTEKLGSKLNADIDFKRFNFTTKFIQFTDIEVHNIRNEYNFTSKQLYFEYSFWELILNHFNIIKAIRKIRCFSPIFSYNIQPKKMKKNIDDYKIENLLKQLNYISIINGKVNINSEEKLKFHETLNSVKLKLEKDGDQWKINFSAEHPDDKGKIDISGTYEKESSDFDVSMSDFTLTQIGSNKMKLQNCKINMMLPIRNGKIDSGMLSVDSLNLEVDDQPIFASDINCKLYKNELIFNKEAKISWYNYDSFITGKIINYLTKDPEFDLKIRSNGIDMGKFSPEINGILSFKGKIKDKFSNYRIELKYQCPSIKAYSQNIENLSGNVSYQKDIVDFHSGKFAIKGNPVSFLGNVTLNKKNLEDSEINFRLSADKFQFPFKNLEFNGDVAAQLSGNIKNPMIVADISELELSKQIIDLNHLSGKIKLIDNKLMFAFRNSDYSIILSGQGNNLLSRPVGTEFSMNIKSDNLSLNKLYKDKFKWLKEFEPNLDLDINISMNSENVNWNGFLNFPERKNNHINGKIILSGNYPLESENNKGIIKLHSDSLRIQDKNYSLNCIATTHSDSILLKEISIDDAIFLTGKFTLPINNKKSFYYKGSMQLTALSINKVNNIFSLSDDRQEILGNINGKIEFASNKDTLITGNIQVDSLLFNDKINPLGAYLSFGLNDKKLLNFNNIKIYNDKKDIFEGNASISLSKGNLFNLYGKGNNINIKNDLLDAPFYGVGDYEILATGTLHKPRLLCNFDLKNGKIFTTKYDILSAQFFQDNEIFYLNKFKIVKSEKYKATAKGNYSYNFFEKQFYDNPDGLNISIEGDYLSIIADYIDDIKQASGITKLNLTLATKDKKVVLKSGELNIKDGEMQIKGQPERLKEINLHADLAENQIKKLEGSIKIGDGKLLILNSFEDESRNINIGGLKFGTILLTTDKKGVSVHIPVYMPERALVDLQLKGFKDEFFRIYNEDDAFKFSGKILLANGRIINPLLKAGTNLFSSDMPINCNFDLVFQKNMWFTYNALNLYIEHNNFISFRTNSETGKTDIFFDANSHRGEIRLFGETFKVDNVEIKKGQFDKRIQINADFQKKTPDGSTIYLNLTSAEENKLGKKAYPSDYGNFRITLHSDNPKDVTMLSILSKLHYGKDIGELSEEERNNLYREEAIKIASDELSNLLFGSILMPVESTIRQFLGLDFFRLKTGFMGNIMRESGLIISEEDLMPKTEPESQFERISELSKNIILENLSVTMGKYITPNWYINYEALVQKELTSSKAIKIGVQHEISFRYDLPFNFRLTYLYRFSPITDDDIQRISLETVINF